MRGLCRRHPLASYLLLCYSLSWVWWWPIVVRGELVTWGDPWPTHMVGLLGPGVAALTVTAATDGRAGVRDLVSRMCRWRVAAVWYALCAATIVLGLAVAIAVGRHFSWFAAARYSGVPDLGLPLTFLVVLVVNGLGEETGWRGFVADRLLRRHGVLATALIVAAAWGLWHLPLFFMMASFQGLGRAVIGWAFGLFCGSVVLTWLYAATSRSVLLVALWHTSFNLASGTALTSGLPAAVTSSAVMALAVVLAWRQLRGRHASPLHRADLGEAGSR